MKSSFSSSVGRPKALDAAARRKEADEREAQRKRDLKAENDRRRADKEEERRREQQRKEEAERQKEEEHRAAAKKREIERAKQIGAPPPASRSQLGGPPEYLEKQPARPPSRLGSTIHQEGRLVNTTLSKSTAKRTLQQHDAGDESSRPRNTLVYQSTKDASKRLRKSDEFDDDIEMGDSQGSRMIKKPSVGPGFKKELPKLTNGYATAPSQSASRDLFKHAVHNSHMKPGVHPKDMATVSKGQILFAPNPNAAKTPGRPGQHQQQALAKAGQQSATRRSPRFQNVPNGDSIELPEIQTDDDEDSSDDDRAGGVVAAWADSPALKSALIMQENLDPMAIFGPPAPLNLEEVFNKSKDRHHKFRARTSSANWSGADRLTEEEIRKDLLARNKMRKDGGWSYDLSRDL